VKGRGDFPIDMLRYDRCTPLTESDSGRIERTFDEEVGEDENAAEIDLKASEIGHQPTQGRWQSFGWTVISFKEE
jgi:hypothetical protein